MCFGFLKPSLVKIRSFIGKPYLRGSTSPSNQKVSCVWGATRLASRNLLRRLLDRGMARPVPRDPSALRHKHRIDDVNDAILLVDIGNRHERLAAFRVDDFESAAILPHGQLFA